MEKLRLFINSLSKDEQKRFAAGCKTSIGYLRKAISESELLNPVTCARIEAVSNGAVTRMDLRPDDGHVIWPELAKQPINQHHRKEIRRKADKADRRHRKADK